MIWRVFTHLRIRWHDAMADRSINSTSDDDWFDRFLYHHLAASDLRKKLEAMDG